MRKFKSQKRTAKKIRFQAETHRIAKKIMVKFAKQAFFLYFCRDILEETPRKANTMCRISTIFRKLGTYSICYKPEI